MCLTARNLVISLLILAQGFVLWQGAFAAALITLETTNNENPVHCHQTPVSDHTQINLTQTHTTNDKQNCCNKGCIDVCHCNHCTCSVSLVSSYFVNRFYQSVLNGTTSPTYLDGLPAQLFKPPQKFRS